MDGWMDGSCRCVALCETQSSSFFSTAAAYSLSLTIFSRNMFGLPARLAAPLYFSRARLAPVLIKEITRRVNLNGIFSAVYTAGVLLPGAVGVARYYHRSINVKKLVEVGFTRVPRGKTLALQIKKHRTREVPLAEGFRELEERDLEGAWRLVMNYLKK